MERVWPIFSRIIECDKPQGTIYKCSKRYTDDYCGSYNIISVTPKRLLQTIIFEKKIKNSSDKKVFGLNILALSIMTNLRRRFIRVQKVFWHLLWKL